jgi:adenosylcobinamide kinase/adenosylcobinamide-phosphate guanylyltransferase
LSSGINSHLVFVLGGARSGKSRHAESLVARHPPPWRYIATADAWDDEMRERIAEHRARRDARWNTSDAPVELVAALADARDSPVLIDCLTLWLTNLMLGGHDCDAICAALADALAVRRAPTVVVSNEVGLGIVPDNALARRFRDAAGRMHQSVAAVSGTVVFMVAGLPMIVRGTSP